MSAAELVGGETADNRAGHVSLLGDHPLLVRAGAASANTSGELSGGWGSLAASEVGSDVASSGAQTRKRRRDGDAGSDAAGGADAGTDGRATSASGSAEHSVTPVDNEAERRGGDERASTSEDDRERAWRRPSKTVRWAPGLKDTQRGPLRTPGDLAMLAARRAERERLQAEEQAYAERVAAQLERLAEDSDEVVEEQRRQRQDRVRAIQARHHHQQPAAPDGCSPDIERPQRRPSVP